MMNDQLARLWQWRILSCAQSGLSIGNWCEFEGTAYRQYGWWRERLEGRPSREEGGCTRSEWSGRKLAAIDLFKLFTATSRYRANPTLK